MIAFSVDTGQKFYYQPVYERFSDHADGQPSWATTAQPELGEFFEVFGVVTDIWNYVHPYTHEVYEALVWRVSDRAWDWLVDHKEPVLDSIQNQVEYGLWMEGKTLEDSVDWPWLVKYCEDGGRNKG